MFGQQTGGAFQYGMQQQPVFKQISVGQGIDMKEFQSTTTEENNGMQVELTHKTEKSSGPTTTNNQKCTKLLLLQTKSERRKKFGILKSFKDMLMMSSMPSPEEMFLSA